MNTQRLRLARTLITIPALFLAIVPAIADFGESHVTNELWIAHARLHTVWLVCTNSLICLIALVMAWRGEARSSSLLLASALVGAVLAGFFIAAATQSLYDGSLTDPNGISRQIAGFDANLFAFSALALLLMAGAWLARDRSAPSMG